MMAKKIRSKSDLCRGKLVDKPRRAITLLYTADGEELYKCPNCGNVATMNDCDGGGAEPGCLFCNQCYHEFDTLEPL